MPRFGLQRLHTRTHATLNVFNAACTCCGHAPQTPTTNFVPERRYTFCIWGRLAPSTSFYGITLIELVYSGDVTSTLAVTRVTWSPSWARYCISDHRPVVATSGYFAFYLGAEVGTYDLDDVSLSSSDAGPNPIGFFTPSKVAALATFEAVQIPFTSSYVLHNQAAICFDSSVWLGVIAMDNNAPVSGVLVRGAIVAARARGMGFGLDLFSTSKYKCDVLPPTDILSGLVAFLVATNGARLENRAGRKLLQPGTPLAVYAVSHGCLRCVCVHRCCCLAWLCPARPTHAALQLLTATSSSSIYASHKHLRPTWTSSATGQP